MSFSLYDGYFYYPSYIWYRVNGIRILSCLWIAFDLFWKSTGWVDFVFSFISNSCFSPFLRLIYLRIQWSLSSKFRIYHALFLLILYLKGLILMHIEERTSLENDKFNKNTYGFNLLAEVFFSPSGKCFPFHTSNVPNGAKMFSFYMIHIPPRILC